MHPALWKLIALRWKGTIRSWLRGLRTWKGALFSVVGLLVFGGWLVPQILAGGRSGGTAAIPGSVTPELRTAAPFLLLAFCVLQLFTSRAMGAFPFVPAEVLYLFAGPFTRRQVLAYKMLTGLASITFTALIFSVFLFRQLSWWVAFVGCFLTWLFLDLVPKALFLLKQSITERAYTRGRKALLYSVVVLGLWGLAQGATTARLIGIWEFLEAVRQSWPGAILLAPFEVFAQLVFAERIVPDFLAWAGVAAAINACAVALIFRLDANYLAAADEQSRRNYARVQRARRGTLFAASARSARSGAWIRPLPWLAGAGPVAWQQAVTAVRTAGTMLAVLLVVFAGLAPVLSKSGGVDQEGTSIVVGGVFAYSFFFLPMMLRFDFRGSLERIEILKTLPLRPVAASCGQLMTPVVIASGLHTALLLGASLFLRTDEAWVVPVAIAFVVPFNFVFFGVENLVFLLFPSAGVGTGPGGFQNMGRMVVTFLIKASLLTAFLGPAAALGGGVYWLSGGSWWVAMVMAWHLVVIGAVAVVPCVAWAFERFDPSVDMPK